MRYLSMAIFAFLLIYACKPSGSSDQSGSTTGSLKDMEDALMVVHDTAMVKLNEINHLSGELRKIRAEVNVTDEGAAAYPAGLDNVLEDLKLADQGMWDWMKAYADNKKVLQEDQLKEFYKKEMEKITAVAAAIDSSIMNAKTWLAAHGTTPQ